MAKKKHKGSKSILGKIIGTLWHYFLLMWRNFYLRHLMLAAVTLLFIVFVTSLSLNIYTRHGQTYLVPNVVSLPMNQARQVLADAGMRLEINDSVYAPNRPRGAVLEQNPKPASKVKQNRTVFVTMNATMPRMARLPDIRGMSIRQAKSTLELQGFEVGILSFTQDIATGNVLNQYHKGRPAVPGQKLVVGSRVDLSVGKNEPSVRTAVPELRGLSAAQAKSVIIESSLNVGRIYYDSSVQSYVDSLNARVYEQIPRSTVGESLEVGALVEIRLTTHEALLDFEPNKE